MITYLFILIAFIAVICGNWNCLRIYSIKEKAGLLMLFLCMSIICGGAVSVIPQLLIREGNGGTLIKENVYSIPIISVKNKDTSSASFFLGCGSINSTEYYVYFKQNADGGIKKDKLMVDICSLYERQKETPRIEWTEATKRVHWVVRFGFDKTDIQVNRVGDFKIIVPEGTIIEKFEIE